MLTFFLLEASRGTGAQRVTVTRQERNALTLSSQVHSTCLGKRWIQGEAIFFYILLLHLYRNNL